MKYSPLEVFLLVKDAYLTFYYEFSERIMKTNEEEMQKYCLNTYGYNVKRPKRVVGYTYSLETIEGFLITCNPHSFTVRANLITEQSNYVQLMSISEVDYPKIVFDQEWHRILEEVFISIEENNKRLKTKHKPPEEIQNQAIEQLMKRYHQNKLRKQLK